MISSWEYYLEMIQNFSEVETRWRYYIIRGGLWRFMVSLLSPPPHCSTPNLLIFACSMRTGLRPLNISCGTKILSVGALERHYTAAWLQRIGFFFHRSLLILSRLPLHPEVTSLPWHRTAAVYSELSLVTPPLSSLSWSLKHRLPASLISPELSNPSILLTMAAQGHLPFLPSLAFSSLLTYNPLSLPSLQLMYLFAYLFIVLEAEPRVSFMLSMHSTPEVYPQFYCDLIFSINTLIQISLLTEP